MSFALHGLAVSPGIAIGYAHLVSHAALEVSHYILPLEHVEEEITRLHDAVAQVQTELAALRAATDKNTPAELLSFLDLHGLILADPMIVEAACQTIRQRQCNAEWALVQQLEILVAQFEEFEDVYLRERKADIVQVVERLLKVLMGHPGHAPASGELTGLQEDMIVVAHDLSPADTIAFKHFKIAGFVTDVGGATSHTAIVARSLNIPAIVGLHHARHLIHDRELLIVDGTHGVLIVDPAPAILEEYRQRAAKLAQKRIDLTRLKMEASLSLDAQHVSLQANIELPQDVEQVLNVNADGIGLFRTEFLFLNRDELPNEEEQFIAYRAVAEAMQGRPVTIRTLDVGADKALNRLEHTRPGPMPTMPNPALGLRAIRYCLSEPHMFLKQLRAILRASHYGNVRLLIPMLAYTHEIDQTLFLLEQAKISLRAQHIPFNELMEIGGMIEIPAAALAIGLFVNRLDFLSIGTNDLIQYTLAIDRTDEAVAHLYDPLHPAILRLIKHTIRYGSRMKQPVSVCGEMAGDPTFSRLLLGMGLRQFSMHPAHLFEVKEQVLRSDLGLLRQRVREIFRIQEPRELREQLLSL